ncbi:YkyB family protein [Bacillus sp. B15-48]|uniref:YkyB family protein n=1 Tax=Bacillus sp. B15-48 TaxID=1548601 RepID=UPI00193FA0E5|nr:YkyB family protein [Bacillus sp. B15-48]MBM4764337.1 hypothetical protein [Bacillus sp. B15-48]
MNSERNRYSPLSLTIENLSQAIYIVNRHAKTAPNPKFLYHLKHEALLKLVREGKAKKIGLHFSRNPKLSQQQSDVLIVCGEYSFHIPPTKSDFDVLPHLGKLDSAIRNPKAKISLAQAKTLLLQFTGIKEDQPPRSFKRKKQYEKPVFKKLGESYF